MAEPKDKPTHDDAVSELGRLLINSIVLNSEKTYGDTPREKLLNYVKDQTDERVMLALDSFSAYRSAKAAERQASAMESLATSLKAMSLSETTDSNAQAIVDERESKREYLAATYSLDTESLMLLWSIRGMLMDASVKSLSRPDRFDPYRRLSTEELAWSLRLSPEAFVGALPRQAVAYVGGEFPTAIDYHVLEDFDIMHYGGTAEHPDEWMYGG